MAGVPLLVYAEQYEATPLRARSFRYTSTFGLFYGDYDWIVIPRGLSLIPRNRIITNLSNLNGENTFQVGFSKRIGFHGNLAFSLAHSFASSEKLRLDITRTYTDELYNDGINDTFKLEEEVSTENERGDPLPYRESSYTEAYAGYGHMLSKDLYFGGGFAYIRDSESRDYDLPELGGTSKGIYGFGDSTLRERKVEFYEMIKNARFFSTRESEEGDVRELNQSFFLFGGATWSFTENLSISADLLLAAGELSVDGSGNYRKDTFSAGDTPVYREAYTASTSLKSYILGLGAAIEMKVKRGDHEIFLDGGYFRNPGEVSEGRKGEDYIVYERINLTGKGERMEMVDGKYRGGRFGADTLFVVSLRNTYSGWRRLKVGYGIEYIREKITHEKSWVQFTYTLTENFDDGDNEVNDSDDYKKTATAKMGRVIEDVSLLQEIGFPLAVILDLGEGIEILAGIKHIFRKSERKRAYLLAGDIESYAEVISCGDGSSKSGNELPPYIEGKWIDRNSSVEEEVIKEQETSSITRIRFGVSLHRFENLLFEFMVDTGVGDGIHSALDLTRFYLSGLFRF